MWDEHGDLIDSSRPEGSKALKQLLCRPVSHLWMDSPEARGRHGQVGGGRRGEARGEGGRAPSHHQRLPIGIPSIPPYGRIMFRTVIPSLRS